MVLTTWETHDGSWTVASFIVRSLCTAPEVTPAELYFVLTSLGIEDYFKDLWKDHRFFERADILAEASLAIDPKRDGRVALSGDHAWAAGDLAEASRRYQRSIDCNDSSTMVGIGGHLRLHFVKGEYQECVDVFRNICPPHQYYEDSRLLWAAQTSHKNSTGEWPANWYQQHEQLDRRYRGRSSGFITQAKYMCQAIVTAGVLAGDYDQALRQMISDYFDLEPTLVDELAQAVSGNQQEISRLCKRLAPKPVTNGRTLEQLRLEGDTKLGRRLCYCIPRSEKFVEAVVARLESYLDSGDPEFLDKMVAVGTPMGVADADGLILSEALKSRSKRIATLPRYQLVLMRRFNSICYMGQYPTYDYLSDYMEIMTSIQTPAEPGDIMAAILDLQWYKTKYVIDNTGVGGSHGGLGKTEISKHREWLELTLSDHSVLVDRGQWANRDKAIAALHEAYLFLRERFKEVRCDERWISEAQLGDALVRLFGKNNVERHARPVWLSPQHLDFYIPRAQLAVEYMGEQHYQPVDLFGGEQALKETQKRDDRKRHLCEQMGVSLVYVTYEEDIGRRAREIQAEFDVAATEIFDDPTDIT
jgi:hypothetical protein